MTYSGLFEKCRTTGECRRVKVMLLCTAQTDLARYEIENAYMKRVDEIRSEHGTGKVVLDESRTD